MSDGSKQALMERVESLEAEVEEQRLLLSYALDRFDGRMADLATEDVTDETASAQAIETIRTVADGRGPNSSPGPITAQSPAGSYSGQESFAEPNLAKDEGSSFGALGELFRLRGWEWWLNKIGIGLLLFGVAFLFKFSVDQGWLTPEVRVGIGLALGAALIWLGLRVYEDRRAFSQVLLGGGIGVFYITGFAAFQLYAMVPYALAVAFMIAVTLLAFSLSIRQAEVVLSMIGATGGFGTPFLLYDGSGTLGGLVLYTALILAGVAAIYLYQGWCSLLLVSAVGSWTVVVAGYTQASGPVAELGRPSLQAGAFFAALVLWLTPVTREVLRGRRPGRWPALEPGKLTLPLFDGVDFLLHPSVPAHLLSVVMPVLGLAFTQEIWSLPKEPLGWIALGGATVYSAVAVTLRRLQSSGLLYYTNALTALLLFTFGILLVLEGNPLFITLAVEAAVLHLVARQLSDKVVSALAHVLFLAVGVWFVGRILSGVEGVFTFGTTNVAFLNVDALMDLSAIALAFGVSVIVWPQSAARGYRIAGHAAVLGMLFRELIGVPGGDTIAFLAWAAYAAILHILSRRYRQWGTVVGSYAIWAVVGLWLTGRLAWGSSFERVALLDLPAVADLIVISLALFTSVMLAEGRVAVAYRVVAHAAVLAWLWRELAAFPDGAAYVTISWGVYAAGLLVFGLRRASAGLVRTAVITLFLVVGKLVLVDLVWVSAVWRILLFLGFGGLFLILSYYLQVLWKTGAGSSREPS